MTITVSNPTELNPLVAELQKAYVEERRKSKPAYALPKYPRNAYCWKFAARQVISLGAEPAVFVKSVFASWEKRRSPQAKDLCGISASNAYRDWNGE